MRTSINVEDYGVLLRGIEIQRLDKAVVVVVLAISTLNRTDSDGGVVITYCRILGAEQLARGLTVGAAQLHNAGNVERRVCVEEIFAALAHRSCMPALGSCEACLLACLEFHAEEVVVDGRYLGRGVIYILIVL